MEGSFEAWDIERAIDECSAMVESSTPDTKAWYFYKTIENTLLALHIDIKYRDDLLRRMDVLEQLCLSLGSNVLSQITSTARQDTADKSSELASHSPK